MTIASRPQDAHTVSLPSPVPGGSAARGRALRHLATPVAVLTVHHQGRPHGTTVSTVTPISHEPLLLGACLRGGSSFAGLAVAAGRFVVNVLDASQADVARYFADGTRPLGEAQFSHLLYGTDPYTDAPLLDGALAVYTCRVFGHTPVGDHQVLLGHVTHLAFNGGDPLLSYAGDLFSGPLSKAPGSR